MMVLSHVTTQDRLPTIVRDGLRPNSMGIVYLSPKPQGWRPLQEGEVLLHVTINGQRLTSFEDCAEWEVLCWGSVPPEDIVVMNNVVT